MEAGAVLAGRYRLDRRLGMGGMGEVWQGRDLTLPRDVAVKLLLNPEPDEVALKRFHREAAVAAGLQHPCITVVHDAGLDDGRRFIVMEFLRGTDLRRLLAAEPGGLAADRALGFGIQIADALAAAHEAGIVHRDLKPDNLMVLPGDRIKVCDFGIARDLTASTLTNPGDMFGTPPYMAPEQWQGRPVTASADLYAFGCILTQMLGGRLPVEATTMVAYMNAHLTQAPVPLREMNPQISPELNDFVLSLLAKDPAQRPPDAVTVRSTLTRIRDRSRTTPTPTITARPLPRATPMACGNSSRSHILWTADHAGTLRSARWNKLAQEWSRPRPDLDVPSGPVTAVATVYARSRRDISAVAVVAGGVPYVTREREIDSWRSLCEAGSAIPLHLPVTEVALTRGDSLLNVYVVDSASILWVRSYDDRDKSWTRWKQTKSPVAGRVTSIAIEAGGILDVVATAEGNVCYRGVPFEATRADLGRPIVDVAYSSARDLHSCLFALDDAGRIWQLWDWRRAEGRIQSRWGVIPGPDGRVTGIVADDLGHMADIGEGRGILFAATADDAIHHAMYTLDSAGRPRWSSWTRL